MIEQFLDKLLLNRDIRVDRFDGDYLDDFHHIMRENYNINSLEDTTNEYFVELVKTHPPQDNNIENYGKFLKSIKNLDISKYSPNESTDNWKFTNSYHTVNIWDKTKNQKLNDNNVDDLNELQAQYSYQHGGNSSNVRPANFWDRGDNTIVKNELFKNLCTPETRVLCIGPRWVTELTYISNTFNCQAFGLDLLVKDQEPDKTLITKGDMHDMPFEDNQFDIVYQKNTFNKSYDIRKCLDECVRVLNPGGVLISDECLGYKQGVNEISRTNINRNSWYTTYLQDHIDEVLVDKEIVYDVDWLTYGGLYAAKIKK